MSGGVTVEADLAGLERILGDAAVEAAQRQFAQGMIEVMEPLVPKDTGLLRDSAVRTGDDEITYTEEYAAEVYFGVGRNFTEPGTGALWDERAKAERSDEIEALAASCLGVL